MKRILLFFVCLLFITAGGSAQETLQAPGLDVLGFGYDIFGKYADMSSKMRYRLFEYDNYRTEPIGTERYALPEFVILENMSRHVVKTVEGSSQRDYSQSLSAQVGLRTKALFFSGSVNSSFNWSSSGSVQKYYYTYMDANIKWRINFDERHLEDLKAILEPQAARDINTMDPPRLFELYGTHYISRAYLGGRADFTTESEVTSETSMEQLAVAVRAKYKVVSANANLSRSEQEAVENTKMSSRLTVVGGSSEYANNIQDPAQYERWASGIKDYPVLCDFDTESLRPIWELADSPGRRQELQSFFEELCAARPLPPAMANLVAMEHKLYMVKNKAADLYWDLPGYNQEASERDAYIQMYESDRYNHDREGADRFVKIIPHTVDTEWVFLQPQHSEYVADIESGSREAGAKLQLWDFDMNRAGRQFKLIPVDNEFSTYYIQSRVSGLFLETDGLKNSAQVIQREYTGEDTQKWVLEQKPASAMAALPDGYYTVQHQNGGKFWDFGGSYPNAKTGPLQLWNIGTLVADRVVRVRTVENNAGVVWNTIEPLHLHNGALTSGGMGKPYTVERKTRNNSQLFRFDYAGSPDTWCIMERSELAMDPDADRIHENGCPVAANTYHGGVNQRWVLTPVTPPPALGNSTFFLRIPGTEQYLDVKGHAPDNNKNRANVQIYEFSDNPDRRVKFLLQDDGTYLIEFQHGGRVLDVEGGDRDNGTNLIIWEANGNPWQRFRLIRTGEKQFAIENAYTGKRLDITEESNGFTNGDNIKQYEAREGRQDQTWELIYADGSRKGEVWGW